MTLGNRWQDVLGVAVPQIAIVDVGAMAERQERYASLVDCGLAHVVGFEPNAEELARLRAQGSARRRYLPDVLGRGGPAVLHMARYAGCSSLYRPNTALIELFDSIGAATPGGNFFVVEERPVETRRLEDVAECPPPDYLKLDVQGAELDVLAGAGRALAKCVVVEAEVEFVPLYEGQPLYGDVESFLRARGFLLHKLIDVSGRTFRPFQLAAAPRQPLSQLLWADAVFVRDFTRLDELDGEQLLKAAAILHEVYRSDDLAHRCLAVFDRQQNTSAAPAFARYLGEVGLDRRFLNLRA